MFLVEVPALLNAQPGDDCKGVFAPPPEGVHSEWKEGQPLGGAEGLELPHLGLVGVFDHVVPLHSALDHCSCLEGVDHHDVQTCTLAIGPGRDEHVRRPYPPVAQEEVNGLFSRC